MFSSEQYMETQVMTASAERLHLMVVDAALRSSRQAHDALLAADLSTAFGGISRCQACLAELIAGFNQEVNPELVGQMQALFVFLLNLLTKANLEKDPQPASEVVRLLEMHRESWIALMDRLQKGRVAAPVAAEHAVATGSNSWLT